MDSSGLISRLGTRMMPFLAILRYELRGLWSSWLIWLWLAGTAFLTLVLALILCGNNMQTAPVVAWLLFPYLVFPWFVVVIVLGISPVTGLRLEALADGILSRPVTRYEYLLASWAARVVVVLGGFLLVMVPAVFLLAGAERAVDEDEVTLYGIIASLSAVGLVLTFLVSLAFLVGTLLRRPLLATVLLILAWFPAIGVLHQYSLEEFSPISLTEALPTLLQTPWRASAEKPEDKVNEDEKMEALAQRWNAAMRELKGESEPEHGYMKDDEEYEDFSLTRVSLGYGLPTLAAISLATLCFCRRDL